MKKTLELLKILVMVAAIYASASAWADTNKPTVVMVHGAFADSSSWNGVIRILEEDGYTVIAAANPLRSVKSDAQSVSDLVSSIKGPVVLVGHSYGGPVISEAAYGQANVKALVYVSAFAPDAGESAVALTGKFPGATLGPALATPVELENGGRDLYIQQDKFPAQFAADVPLAEARLMAATQRPVTEEALNEAATAPAWKDIPSWWIYGDKDLNIPPAALRFMADRAKAQQTVVVKGASHVVMISNPGAVAKIIQAAATSR